MYQLHAYILNSKCTGFTSAHTLPAKSDYKEVMYIPVQARKDIFQGGEYFWDGFAKCLVCRGENNIK
jgi:hypothetical protein